jgi:hypothetical protein
MSRRSGFAAKADNHSDKTTTPNCAVCHEAVVIEEPSPETLETPGLGDRMAALRRK